jgi:hypothetical protein
MTTKVEEFAAEIGRHVFLREFSFSKNTFRAACGSELELADHVIALPAETLVFQIKERDARAAAGAQSIVNWFNKKVLKDGCGQLRDSEAFLRDQPQLLIANQRGHTLDLARRTSRIVKILLYSASGASLPHVVSSCRHRTSGRAGFVHVVNIEDYYHLCRCLLAPRELSEYFAFRQQLLESANAEPPEEAMIAAMFIAEATSPLEDTEARRILDAAVADNVSFDLGPILSRYADRIVYHQGEVDSLDYYKILEEFCRLHRADLRALKKLMTWALEHAGADEPEIPCRMKASSSVGFVVLPVPAAAFKMRVNGLINFTTLMKYDWKLEKAIGISFAKGSEMIDIDWCLVEGKWAFDPEIDQALQQSYPFRKTPEARTVVRYPW